MAEPYFEEEEFDTSFDGGTLMRILAQTKPHWKWVAGISNHNRGLSCLSSQTGRGPLS